jgi:hypothetical protein
MLSSHIQLEAEGVFLTELLPMLTRRMKLHLGPTLLRKAQIHTRVGKVSVIAIHVFC